MMIFLIHRSEKQRREYITSLLWYVPLLVFHTALAGFWVSIFGSLASWLHLPFLRGLSGTDFWLPLPSSMLLRWVLALPLTSWIALLLEAIRPHTNWEARRVLSPDEKLQLAAAKAADEKKHHAARRTSQTQVTASARKTVTRTRSRPPTERSSSTTIVEATRPPQLAAEHTASLWDQIDWSQVPDTHPLKQAALEEAEHTRSVLSQMAQQKATTPPGSAATKESVSPPPAPTYNWDEGEGTVTDS